MSCFWRINNLRQYVSEKIDFIADFGNPFPVLDAKSIFIKNLSFLGLMLGMFGFSGGASESLEERVDRLRLELAEAEEALAVSLESREADAPTNPKAIEAFSADLDSLVIVAGDAGRGSGFLAEIRGRRFFVTNTHVLGNARDAEFTTPTGQTVNIGTTAFISRRRDLAIIPVEWDGPTFTALDSVRDRGISIGDEVTVIGNADGGGVATNLVGRIMGIGPHEIETDATFVPGNSGSPIIHNHTGLVVGIASYVRNMERSSFATKGTAIPAVRRFGFRLDGDLEWEQMSLEALWRQGEVFQQYERKTRMLLEIAHNLMYERRVLTGYRSDQELGYMFADIGNNFRWERGTTSPTNVRLLENFIRTLRAEIQRDREAARRALTVDHYKTRFSNLDELRILYDERLSTFRF